MSKPPPRWSLWKVVLAFAACVAISATLFLVAALSNQVSETPTGPSGRVSGFTLPSFLMMLGTAAAILAVLSGIWLGYRLWEARLPPWEQAKRRQRKKR